MSALVVWNPLNWKSLSMMSNESTSSNPSVIIVGGGLAGLSATIEAVRHGARVTIIEKESKLGGNSAKATSGINAVGTDSQKVLGIDDSVNDFIKDTVSSGQGLANEELVKVLVTNSNAAIQFLSSFGLDLSDVVQLGGHSAKRTHRFPPSKEGKPVPVGFTIMSTLRKYVENDLKDKVTVLTKSTFKQLILENGKAVGLIYKSSEGIDIELHGTIVLTAGGYANDHTATSLLDKYVPHLSSFPTTNGPWATGDIIKAVENDGVSLILMDRVQVHPTGFVDPKDPKFHTKFLAPEALRGCGGILLNAEGERFVNELGRRDHVSNTIFKSCSPFEGVEENPIVASMLLTQKMIDRFGAHLVGFYVFKGLIQKVGLLSGVAEKLNVPKSTIERTIENYNAAASTGSDSFGKTSFPLPFTDDDVYYVASVTPTLHYCMGGLEINSKAQVEKSNKTALTGLYAAGEVSGGVHGHNRLGGNSLLECVVFGRIAGKEAAHFNS